MARVRIDSLLADRGLAPSRTAAALLVRAGEVRIGSPEGPRASKPSQTVEPEVELHVESGPRYVSRGGVKLENALAALRVDPSGRDCLDVGASTGGFTDCLLQHGASRVIALDVAHGQLDWGIRNDDRVTVIERTNARELGPDDLPFLPELVTIDVSFISLAKVLPAVAVAAHADQGAHGTIEILAMVKPQFELDARRVGKGGVVRDPEHRRQAIRNVVDAAERCGLIAAGIAPSGLPGPKGNRETFVQLRSPGFDAGERSGTIDLDAELERLAI